MKEWMTQEDLCQYLQASPSIITNLMKKSMIPCHLKLGQPRFFRQEIDEWMLSESSESTASERRKEVYEYRGQSIKNYLLTASKIMIGPAAWSRLPDFIKKTSELVKHVDRKFLFRKEFEPMIDNYNDYLRVSCQLGLIDNIRQGRITHYFPNDKLKMINTDSTNDEIRALIRACILDVVTLRKEEVPQERHAIFLLWYLLKLKESGNEPVEADFNKGHETNDYPMIRFNFTKGLCNFLFDGNLKNELEFLQKWESLL